MAKTVIKQTTYTCDICGYSWTHQGIENCSIKLNISNELAGYTTVYEDVCDTCRKKVIQCIDGLKEGDEIC